MIFNVGDYYDEAKASDEEVAAYYKSHENDFYSPEHLKIEYVVLSPEDFKKDIKPNEEEVKVFYEQNQNRWSVPEERRASHILLEFGDDKAAALKKAEALLAEAKADPSKFGELAKANSVDTGSANDGGDLSYFGRGVMVKPFEDAVFAAKKGDIVGPVESEFGYHIIYVTDVRDQHVKKFEEVRGEIEREYVEQMAIRAFSEAADEFTNMVYEQSDTLAPVAEKFGIKIETAENVTREGVEDPALKRVINERVVEHLFGEEALSEKRNTSAVEVASNTLVSARIVEHFPTALQPLDAVRSRPKRPPPWRRPKAKRSSPKCSSRSRSKASPNPSGSRVRTRRANPKCSSTAKSRFRRSSSRPSRARPFRAAPTSWATWPNAV